MTTQPVSVEPTPQAPIPLPPAAAPSDRPGGSRFPSDRPSGTRYAGHAGGPSRERAGWLDRAIMLVAVAAPPLGCAVAIVSLWTAGWMGWLYLGLLVGGLVLSLMGISVAYHRLLAHRSFETTPRLRAVLTSLGAMAVEGSPIRWAGVHRRHHQYSDQLGDPHSPHGQGSGVRNLLRGLGYAQTGWLFTRFWSHADLERYVPDLLRDPVCATISKYYYVFVLISLGIPASIGGGVTGTWSGAWLGLLWGGLVRIFLGHHLTWSVNSICHVFGTRDYATQDHSTNNAALAWLTVGEGWHNNHHAFPYSARFGLRWWQVDWGWWVIRGLQACGLAWNCRVPSRADLASARR